MMDISHNEAIQSMCEINNLRAENESLRRALHDAINRPMGVVPDSAADFYEPHTYYSKEGK